MKSKRVESKTSHVIPIDDWGSTYHQFNMILRRYKVALLLVKQHGMSLWIHRF